MPDARPSASVDNRRLSPEESDYDLACYLEADLDSRFEGAYLSNDRDLIEHLRVMMNRASGLRHRCYDRLRAVQPPTFEGILRDPTSQMDKDGVVARSILNWQDRTMCGQNIPVTSNTASATFSPRPPSFYVCCKMRPCPDHDVTGGSTSESIKAADDNDPSGQVPS